MFWLICSLTFQFLSCCCCCCYCCYCCCCCLCQSSSIVIVFGLGNFIYIREPQNFSMDFQMPATMTRDIKVCLYLRYLMPSRKAASLEIYLHCTNVTSLIFNLTGFHGQKWISATIPIQSFISTKVNASKASEYTLTILALKWTAYKRRLIIA